MAKECHPIWKDLDAGRVRAGQPVEELTAKTPPSRLVKHDNYMTLTYFKDYDPAAKGIHFTGVTIIAKDDRLMWASASSCTWHYPFFDELSPEAKQAYEQSLSQEFDRRRRERMARGLVPLW